MTQLDLVTDDGLDELRAAVGDGNAELQTRGEASLDLNQLLRIADGKEQADRATLDRIYLAHAAGCGPRIASTSRRLSRGISCA